MLKDLLLAQAAASSTGAATPLGAHASEIYEAYVGEGGKGKDFSAMLQRIAQLSAD